MSTKTAKAIHSIRHAVLGSTPGLEVAETLFNSLNDVIFCVKDRQRRYVAANEAFIRSAGLSNRVQLFGRTAREVFPPILAAGYEQQDDEVFAKGHSLRDRVEMITRPGKNIGWFVTQKVPVNDAGGTTIAIASISRDLSIPASAGGGLGPLGAAIDTIHREFSGPLRIETLAKQAGLSSGQFQRRISALTGLTPRQLLTKARIEAAAEALQSKDSPLSAIACECGFYDQAAFCRQFRATTGLSPGEYRVASLGV